MSIARPQINEQVFSAIERLCFYGPCQGVIKGQRRSFELVVIKNWVEFCRRKSKVIAE
jgi:hypothetical protein